MVIVPFLDPTPILPHPCRLGQSLALGCAKELTHTTKVLDPIALALKQSTPYELYMLQIPFARIH